MNNHHEGHDAPPSFWSSRYAIGLVVIGGVCAAAGMSADACLHAPRPWQARPPP